MRPVIRIAPPTDHFSEIILLGIIAGGCIWLAGNAIEADKAGEASAWTAVLMAIISAIKERWTQRSVDRMGQQLGLSTPQDDGKPSGAPGDPVHVAGSPPGNPPVETRDTPAKRP